MLHRCAVCASLSRTSPAVIPLYPLYVLLPASFKDRICVCDRIWLNNPCHYLPQLFGRSVTSICEDAVRIQVERDNLHRLFTSVGVKWDTEPNKCWADTAHLILWKRQELFAVTDLGEKKIGQFKATPRFTCKHTKQELITAVVYYGILIVPQYIYLGYSWKYWRAKSWLFFFQTGENNWYFVIQYSLVKREAHLAENYTSKEPITYHVAEMKIDKVAAMAFRG